MNTPTTTQLDLMIRISIARDSADDLRKWLRRWDRWMASVEIAKETGDYPKGSVLPSKKSKYKAYESAGHIRRCLPELNLSQAQNVDDLKSTLMIFNATYGAVK